jgi:hypothetical protein
MKLITSNLKSIESLAKDFFQETESNWKSQRRYYSLNKNEEPQEVVSDIIITFLPRESPELIQLAKLHELENITDLIAGSKVTWHSHYIKEKSKPSKGSTIFGIAGNILYRDRGFATSKPVKALYNFSNPKTMSLITEYGGSKFEEEIKIIGSNYRTRQTIISRAGEELIIGQYLEKRCN